MGLSLAHYYLELNRRIIEHESLILQMEINMVLNSKHPNLFSFQHWKCYRFKVTKKRGETKAKQIVS